jgi:hypothetical protein
MSSPLIPLHLFDDTNQAESQANFMETQPNETAEIHEEKDDDDDDVLLYIGFVKLENIFAYWEIQFCQLIACYVSIYV